MPDSGGEHKPIAATSDVLWTAAKMIGQECGSQNVAYLECKDKDPNPEKCLSQGYSVTSCVRDVLQKIEGSDCREDFHKWKDCLKGANGNHYLYCRDVQRTFDACMNAK